MSVLLQVSDPHFGTERPAVVAALRRFARAEAPDALVLSGDLTQRARPREFSAARAFVDALGVAQVLVIPGNHDIPLFNLVTRLLAPYGKHRRVFGDELEPVLESAELLVLGVNTTRAYRHEDGEVSPAQVTRVAARLAAADARQLRIVVTHQPVAVLHKRDETNLLHGREPAVRAWAKAGCDLILGGHIHLPFIAALHEQWAGLARPVWAVQAGTAVSSRVRPEAGNSVNLIRAGGSSESRREATVERWDYDSASDSFQRVSAQWLGFDVH